MNSTPITDRIIDAAAAQNIAAETIAQSMANITATITVRMFEIAATNPNITNGEMKDQIADRMAADGFNRASARLFAEAAIEMMKAAPIAA